ncbi:unnamed protein product [Linum tenue]|uniref:Uncharacterized protein n=1 Tax=Linum tenue TaxID=586396 RepID=A0AAV0ICE8_9ROSI|nr:unnamed protein product [Linum tenue]
MAPSRLLTLFLSVALLALLRRPAAAQTTTVVRGGYWFPGSGFAASAINSTLFTHLFFAFAGVDSGTFRVNVSAANQPEFSTFTQTVQRANPSVKTLLSIGGGDANITTLAAMANQPGRRKAFIDSSISLARSYNFHGLDLDWQYPSDTTQMANFGDLLTGWKSAVAAEAESSGKPPLLLSAAVLYLSYYYSLSVPYPVLTMSNTLDWINLMAYDFYGPEWSPTTAGPPAALYNPGRRESGDSGVNSWIQSQFPANKIVLGIPFYGWSWRLSDSRNRGIFSPANGAGLAGDGSAGYDEINEFIAQNRATKVFDPAVISDYCYSGTTWIGYDDVRSVSAKVAYAKNRGLLGYYVWHVGADDNWTLSTAGKGGSDAVSLFAGETEDKNPRMVAVPYSSAQLEKATNDFSIENKVGQGGYGPVYKGVLADGGEIAVKKLSINSSQGDEEFKNEVMLTAQLQHVNLVRVLGYCIEGGERMLVYEYLHHKSLDHYLFDPMRSLMMDWARRVEIIEGVTQGLLYLQEYSGQSIIHRDLKPGNILLDSNMKPKISDFGLARILKTDSSEANTERIAGTRAYCPREYLQDGVYSKKSDVYSFGILLLQIISGKRCGSRYGPDGDMEFHVYAYELWKEGRGMEIMDPSLDDSNSTCKLADCLRIALFCIQRKPTDRPSMQKVSSMLRDLYRSDSSNNAADKNIGITDVRFFSDVVINMQLPVSPANSSTNQLTVSELDARS